MQIHSPASLRDILWLTNDKALYFKVDLESDQRRFLESEQFDSMEEALQRLKSVKSLKLVLTDVHYVEETIALSKLLSGTDYLRPILDTKIAQEPAITDELYYHYELQPQLESDKEQYYKIFGFVQKEFNPIVKRVKNELNLDLITDSRHLLFHYIRDIQKVKRPFIAIYRYAARDFMAVSDGKRLLFSRAHKLHDANDDDVMRAISYVTSRFREMQFDLFIGGALTQLNFPLKNMDISVIEEESRDYPVIINALDRLDEKYNFLPVSIKVKKQMRRLQSLFFAASLLFFAIFGAGALKNSIAYSQEKDAHRNVQVRYEKVLQELNLISQEQIDALMRVQKLAGHGSFKELYRILKLLDPMRKAIDLRSFEWEYDSKHDALKLVFEKQFSSLESMDSFLQLFKSELAKMKRAVPLLKMKLHKSFATTSVTLEVWQKKGYQRRYERGKSL